MPYRTLFFALPFTHWMVSGKPLTFRKVRASIFQTVGAMREISPMLSRLGCVRLSVAPWTVAR